MCNYIEKLSTVGYTFPPVQYAVTLRTLRDQYDTLLHYRDSSVVGNEHSGKSIMTCPMNLQPSASWG